MSAGPQGRRAGAPSQWPVPYSLWDSGPGTWGQKAGPSHLDEPQLGSAPCGVIAWPPRGAGAGCHLGHPPVCPGPAHCLQRSSDLFIRVPGTQGLKSHLCSPSSSGASEGPRGNPGSNWEHCVPSWVPICLPTLNARCPATAPPASAVGDLVLSPATYRGHLPPPPTHSTCSGCGDVPEPCQASAPPPRVLHQAWEDSGPGNQLAIPVGTF